MATEEDRQEERDRLDNDPFDALPVDQLEEENPTESPAAERETAHEHDDEERASSSEEPPRPVGNSTEGLTIGGTDKQPDHGAR
jgi:hypothetical protein